MVAGGVSQARNEEFANNNLIFEIFPSKESFMHIYQRYSTRITRNGGYGSAGLRSDECEPVKVAAADTDGK